MNKTCHRAATSALSLLTVGVIALSLNGCGDAKSRVKSQFLSGCEDGGVPAYVCECAWRNMEKKYTTEQFEEMNQARHFPPGFMENMLESARICRRY